MALFAADGCADGELGAGERGVRIGGAAPGRVFADSSCPGTNCPHSGSARFMRSAVNPAAPTAAPNKAITVPREETRRTAGLLVDNIAVVDV